MKRCALLLVLSVLCSSSMSSAALAATMTPLQQAAAGELAARASDAMKRQDYASAEDSYKNLLRIAPLVPELHSNLGLAYYFQDKTSLAEDEFSKALTLKPDLFVPNFFLGEIRFKQGRYGEALSPLKSALQTQPENEGARRLLAAVMVGLKQYGEAIDQYQKMLGGNPRDLESLYNLGRVYLEASQGPLEKLTGPKVSLLLKLIAAEHHATRPEMMRVAIKEYSELIPHLPDVPGLRGELGSLQISAKDWSAAAQSFKDELALDPLSFEARFGLSAVVLHGGDINGALSYLDEAVKIRPEFFNPLPEFPLDGDKAALQNIKKSLEEKAPQGGFSTFYLLSEIAQATGQEDNSGAWRLKADHVLERIRQEVNSQPIVESKFPVPRDRRAEGMKYILQKRYEAGLKTLYPMAAKGQLDQAAMTAIYWTLYRLKEYPQLVSLLQKARPESDEMLYLLGSSYKRLALQSLNRIAEIEPQSARAHQLMGEAYFAQQLYVEAAEEYETAVKLEPNNSEFYMALGNSYFKLFDFEHAGQAFLRSMESDPTNAEAHLMRGGTLIQLRRPEEAIAPLRKAVELDPSMMQSHNKLMGQAFTMMDKPDEAVRYLELASVGDMDGEIHYQLFVLYRKLGQQEKAKEALSEFKKLSDQYKAQQESRRQVLRDKVSAGKP